MPGWDLFLPFLIATMAFAYFPGPALLYTAAQTMTRGRRAGFMAMLGIHIGCYGHIIAAMLGLSAIFRYVPEAYTALKIIGALYLVWLGIQMIRQKDQPKSPDMIDRKGPKRALFESILVELLNPKVAIFFLAFLPQFVDPTASLPLSVQFLVLGMIVNLAFSSADLAAVLLTDRLVTLVRRSQHGLGIARWIGGSVLIVLGCRLALSRQ